MFGRIGSTRLELPPQATLAGGCLQVIAATAAGAGCPALPQQTARRDSLSVRCCARGTDHVDVTEGRAWARQETRADTGEAHERVAGVRM